MKMLLAMNGYDPEMLDQSRASEIEKVQLTPVRLPRSCPKFI